MNPQLGRLAKVEIRDIWKSEPGDFTPWLASDENIALLGETIGLDLEVEAQEKNVGPFRADILCKDTASQSWVLVENQLERTDHIHLGQVVTYAAGLQAATIVWVAARFTDEHRAALDWLNEITSDEFSFFGLEVELWKIGDSMAAPKFNVVCQPNDWSRNVSSAARTAGRSSSGNSQIMLEYWTASQELMQKRGGAVRPTKPQDGGYMNFSLGKSGIWLNGHIRVNPPSVSVMVTIGTDDSLVLFKLLEKDRTEYEARFGGPLEWLERPSRKQKLIKVELPGADPANREDWPRQHAWIHEKLNALHATFSSAARTLDPADYEPDEGIAE
ncbi:DUF4268 domain-containing protein [Stieleria sp. ICT_E10.1]|uniref:DUF4268 domain-containing protein n=1 Tax=Stieleria sedimenti TaxID=2976331 RepID=UPI00217FFD3B|nr:DUF4268 domain-containing protein [Stieleria sedimenti]MCS7468515.1 DUF4268 domain-containing protein [Stieleria sedimenti]